MIETADDPGGKLEVPPGRICRESGHPELRNPPGRLVARMNLCKVGKPGQGTLSQGIF